MRKLPGQAILFVLLLPACSSLPSRGPASGVQDFRSCQEAIAAFPSFANESQFVAKYFPWVSSFDQAVVDSWDPRRFTDPGRHNDARFRYVVHTIDAPLKHNRTVREEFVSIDRLFSCDPGRLMSVSVVDQDKHRTYGSVGFVLEVPSESYVATHYQDVGSPTGVDYKAKLGPEQYLSRFSRMMKSVAGMGSSGLLGTKMEPYDLKIRSPEDILSRTERGSHNELIVRGGTRNAIRIKAIFYRKAPGSSTRVMVPVAPEVIRRQLQETAAEMGVPLIGF